MNLFSRVVKHELITGSFYLFMGGMTANFFAFLLNLFLARNLSYADYGIFASVLSLISLAFIPGSSIGTIIIKFATKFYVQRDLTKFSSFYNISSKILLVVSTAFFLIFVILAFPISYFLKLDNIWFGVLAGLIVGVYYLSVLNLAFLQSLLKFAALSSINVLASFIKLLAGVTFFYFGLRAFSGLLAIFFMTLGMYLVAFIPLKNYISKSIKKTIKFPKEEILSYSLPAFFTIFFLTSFTSNDVILVKHFFNSTDAGFYAGLSLVGRVIFYFTSPIPSVLFPLLVKRHSIGASYKRLFYLALILVFLPSLGLSILYLMFPNLILNIFLGGRQFLTVSNFLGFFGIYITLISLNNVVVNFFLSFSQTKVWLFVVPAAILQIFLISLFHTSFYQVIYLSIIVAFGLLISLFLYYFKKFGL